MAELERETRRVLVDGQPAQHDVFAHPIAFNVIPHIDSFQPNGYTREEMKVVWETRKIMGLPNLPVSCTAVRIPTMRVHAESVTIETERPITPEAAREVLRAAAGVKVVDDVASKLYPMPLTATGQDDCEVGRIRQNLVFGDHGLDLFICGDQLLKGAALNAVQIAERMPALMVAA
jgi:aspartate-semialdehyde dehydrogenase